MFIRCLLLSALLLPGCNHDALSVPPVARAAVDTLFGHAGTRLVPEYYRGDDGAIAAIPRWFDTGTGQECSFGTSDDGALRCMPPFGRAFNLAFADAACTRYVTYDFDEMGLPRGFVFSDFASLGCGSAWRGYRVLEPHTGAIYDLDDNGTCRAGAPRPHYYDIEPVAASAFVRGSVRAVPRGSRLTGSIIDGDDGSRQDLETLPLTDSRTGRACQPHGPGALPGGDYACVPGTVGVATSYQYADGSCSQPLIVANSRCAPDDYLSDERQGWNCPGPVYQAGPVTTPETIFQGGGATCDVVRGNRVAFRSVGRSIAAGELAALTLGGAGEGAVQAEVLLDDSGAPVKLLELRDRMSGRRCKPAMLGDGGRLVCAPADIESLNGAAMYLDAACTERAVVFRHDCPSSPPTLAARIAWPPNQPLQLDAVAALGPRLAVPAHSLYAPPSDGTPGCVPGKGDAMVQVASVGAISTPALPGISGPLH